jgi:hypothetical protein
MTLAGAARHANTVAGLDLGAEVAAAPRPARVPQQRTRYRYQIGVTRGDDRSACFASVIRPTVMTGIEVARRIARARGTWYPGPA